MDEPFLPEHMVEDAMKEDHSQRATIDWYAKALRELARQLTFANDFYYPLIGAAQALEQSILTE